MLRWLADENFNNDILRAMFRANREIDIVRAQDVGLTGVGDETLLAWAADQNRVLLTHDVSTITAHAYRRIARGGQTLVRLKMRNLLTNAVFDRTFKAGEKFPVVARACALLPLPSRKLGVQLPRFDRPSRRCSAPPRSRRLLAEAAQ